MRVMSKFTTQQRVDWLKENKSTWEGFPDNIQDTLTSKEFSRRRDAILFLMKDVGLYSKKTNNIDCNLTSLINLARTQLRCEKL